MTRPSRYPVAAFGPELLAALIEGSRRRLEIPMKTHREIAWLQQRIHMLRGAMGKEKHPQYTLVQRARTSRQWDEPEGTPRSKDGKPTRMASNFRLIIEPNDVQFVDALKAAGIDLSQSTVTNMQEVLEDKPTITPSDPSTAPAIEPTETTVEDPYANFKS